MKAFLTTIFIFSICSILTFAQNIGVNENQYKLTVRKAKHKIILDGKLDEEDWLNADVAKDFWQFFPFDSSRAVGKTEVRTVFDEHFLYIAAVCYQPNKYIVTSLKRDFARGSSDVFGINLDPFKDKLNGFNFAISPYNVQREGLIFNGQDLNTDWDNKWYSNVTNLEDRWIVEMAIPFKTLRYKRTEGQNTWMINFVRNDLVKNEAGAWAPIPRIFPGAALAFSGTLVWEEPPPHQGANVSLIPYLLAASNTDYQNNEPTKTDLNVGFDAKVAVTPSMNLDLTVNPDFAQVEVDRQVTNLSRFELFFPERRQFFLENSDLFGSFGLNNSNPFFSRRIGLVRNPKTGFNEKIPILAGARLSGRLNKNWRLGLLAMQTGRNEELSQAATNYAMIAIQRRIFSRSNLAFVFVNKEPFNKPQDSLKQSFNRVVGLEYNLASADNRWTGKAFYHRSLNPENLANQYIAAGRIAYSKPTFGFSNRLENIGENYSADVGYVPRRGTLRSAGDLTFTYYPTGKAAKIVNNYFINPDYDFIYGVPQGRVLDWDAGLFGGIQFQNSAQLSFALMRTDYTYLFAPFDPSNTGGQQLPANTSYLYTSNRIGFSSNSRKAVFFNLQSRFGKYFNGQIFALQAAINYRLQPYGIFALDFNYNAIRLPSPYSNSDLLLIGPRIELSFSNSLFFTTIMQYNNQVNNVNLNMRLQWRFKPASDLFIVYTDNYYATETRENGDIIRAFQPKNRALVFKLTYWLNM
ncbi:MAG: hydrolase [Cytophagales bacterium]|nr:MAG: hydrolase [Cytophagales bacterium]